MVKGRMGLQNGKIMARNIRRIRTRITALEEDCQLEVGWGTVTEVVDAAGLAVDEATETRDMM